jgi:hypothetical protein
VLLPIQRLLPLILPLLPLLQLQGLLLQLLLPRLHNWVVWASMACKAELVNAQSVSHRGFELPPLLDLSWLFLQQPSDFETALAGALNCNMDSTDAKIEECLMKETQQIGMFDASLQPFFYLNCHLQHTMFTCLGQERRPCLQ